MCDEELTPAEKSFIDEVRRQNPGLKIRVGLSLDEKLGQMRYPVILQKTRSDIHCGSCGAWLGAKGEK